MTDAQVEVLFEDDDVIAINKPSGLMVHPDGRTADKTLVDWILRERPAMTGVGEPFQLSSGAVIERPGIVHRLDKDTTGVLLLAKNQGSFEHLKRQFQNREVRKEYLAFVYGEMPEERGVIDRPIGKSRKDFRLWSAQRGAKGELREAQTEYRVWGKTGGISFIAASPKTGRTHQIRVHFKAINHPVLCDRLYAPKRSCALGFRRAALHARSLTFCDMRGEERTVTAPLPADFVRALTELNLERLREQV